MQLIAFQGPELHVGLAFDGLGSYRVSKVVSVARIEGRVPHSQNPDFPGSRL